MVGERLPDLRAFLQLLDPVQQAMTGMRDTVDPLDAVPGSVLDGRYEVVRRLGSGSTAVGLLVRDLAAAAGAPTTVLKCALDDAASHRLVEEAAVLETLEDHPRVVRLLEGPLEVGGRRALLLSSAGDQTLAESLHERGGRLSLDRLERWGNELLEAMVALDRAGVAHRDVKPSNLGILEGRGDRQKHLVLFDFSLARADPQALTAGTSPYLDPFLGSTRRPRYDSAAERYAASVVLFEMATGQQPVYGDGQTDPAMQKAEVTVHEALFDPALADRLVRFFAQALARDADRRHDTVGALQAAWQSVFARVDTAVPDDTNPEVSAGTPLRRSGLSARALSAVEPLRVSTVADLVAVDAARLSRLPGVAEATRRELREQVRLWRDRLAPPAATPVGESAVRALARRLLDAVPPDARTVVEAVLGLAGGADAFATAAQLSAVTGRKRQRVVADLAAAGAAWQREPQLADVAAALAAAVDAAGVLSVQQAVRVLGGALSEAGAAPQEADDRLLRGLLAIALEDPAYGSVARRRRDDEVVLLARDPALLDAAATAAGALDEAVAAVGPDAVLAPSRVVDLLRLASPRLQPLADADLVALAAAASRQAALSGRNEVHGRALPPAVALQLALQGLSPTEPLTALEVRERVRARFPALAVLPGRPRLDELLADAGVGLEYDDRRQAYRPRAQVPDTTGFSLRTPTRVVSAEAARVLVGGELTARLAESNRTRGFLALGVSAREQQRARRALAESFGAQVVDLTEILLGLVREAADRVRLPWETVLAADAAAAGTTAQKGLAKLVADALPHLQQVVDDAMRAGAPVLLVELGPIARYGHLSLLAHWTGFAASRAGAVWALLPQLSASQGAVVDGRPVPLAAPGQFLRLDADWVAANLADVEVPA